MPSTRLAIRMIVAARRHVRQVWALLAALAIAAAVFALRRVGALDGIPAVAFAVLLACSLPWSAHLSRRTLLAGAVFLGWMPLLWWVRLPVDVDRVGLTLAIASGALAGWVLWGPDVRAQARRLIPRVGPADAMPVVAAAVAVWTTWPLLAASGGDRTLNLLMMLTSWDHVAHAAMVMLIRTKGAIGPMLGPAPDGSKWIETAYPQHFHATVAALTELYSGKVVGDAATQVLMYGRSLALVQVLTAGLLAAGVAQLPSLRRRAVVAWPLAAVVVAAFLFGLGSWALAAGFPNFVLACATVGLAALLAVPMTRELVPLRVFALGGLIVATVHGWAPLALLAIVAGSVAFVPFSRARWPRSRTISLATVAALAVTVAASAAAVPTLASVGGLGALTLAGGNPAVSMSMLLLASGMAIATALAVYVRRQHSESAAKGIMLAAIPGTGLLLSGLLAAYQLVKAGEFSYYFYKLAAGVTLISIVALVASVAIHIGPPPPRRSRARWSVATIAAIVATLAALQLFGFAGPARLVSVLPGLDLAPGVQYRADAMVLTRGSAAAAQRLLRAAAIAQTRPFASTVYVAAMPGDPYPLLADFWQRALSLTWSNGSNAVNPTLAGISAYDGVNQAAEVSQKLLEEAPHRAVVVAPEIADKIRRRLPVELRSRVITWEPR